MGLQSQLNDVSSDSIPLLLIAFIANCFSHLRSSLLRLFHSLTAGASSAPSSAADDDAFLASIGSGLAGLILLADQLNLNRVLSHKHSCDEADGGRRGSKCVVCLCTMRDGELVRKLDCRHVFHKDCLDGWLNHMNFDCPLCRSPLVDSDERVDFARRMRVGGDLVQWFSFGMMTQW